MPSFVLFRRAKDIILSDCRILVEQGRFVELEFFLKKFENILLAGATKYYKVYYAFYSGIVQFNLGRYTESIRLLKDFLFRIDDPSEFPTDQAYYYLIRSYLILGNEAQANVYLNLLADRFNSPLFILLSLYYMRLYNIRHNVNIDLFFEEMKDFDDEPDLTVTELMRLLSVFVRGDADSPDMVRQIRRSFAQFAPYNANYFFSLVRLSFLFHYGFYNVILEHTDWECVSNSFELLSIYCGALYKCGLLDDCINCLQKASICSDAVGLRLNLAKCYIRKNEYHIAIKILSAIRDKTCTDYKEFLIGISQQKLGCFSEAVAAYNKIPAHSPYYDKAMLNAAAAYYDDFDYKRCRELLGLINSPRVRSHAVYRFLLDKTDGSVDTKNISVLIFFMSGFVAVLTAIIIVVFIFLRLIG